MHRGQGRVKLDPTQSRSETTGDDEVVVLPVFSDGEGMLGVEVPASFVSARLVAVHNVERAAALVSSPEREP